MLNSDNNFMILRTKKEITVESTMRSSLWKIDINSSVKKRLELRWRVDLDSIEVWMRLPTAGSKLRTSNICSLRKIDKIWSFKTNYQDLREFWMRSSLRQANSEMRVMVEVIRLLILDLKLQSLKEILISSNLKEPTYSERSRDSEMSWI